ncbi:MAG: hypothetical protein APF76_08980 [Desulfitibacter sp. BRH_c19]|nr:MAG: hypothetical protein APF76_08980 [Desulfitibacter sp. BRH_c19]
MTSKLKLISIIILIIIVSFTLTGCWDTTPVETVGFVISLGIDLDEDDPELYIFTFSSPVFSEDAEENIEVLSTKARSILDAVEFIHKVGGRVYVPDHLQVLLVHENVAKKGGLLALFDTLYRDPEVSSLADLVICKDPAKEIIATNFMDKPRVGIYIKTLLDTLVLADEIMPSTLLLHFRQQAMDYEVGRDPTAPAIIVLENGVYIKNIALFKKDKLVGYLEGQQNIWFTILAKGAQPTFFYPRVDNEYGFITKKTTRKITPELVDGNISFTMDVDMELRLDQSTSSLSMDLSNDDFKKKLEAEVAEYLKAEFKKTVQKMQEVNSDPLGLGKRFRAKYFDVFNEINWREHYPYVDINVNVSVDITQYGIVK